MASMLLARARELGIDKVLSLAPNYIGEVTKANEYYASKGFEYFEITNAATVYPNAPDLDTLTEFASELVTRLKQFATDAAVHQR